MRQHPTSPVELMASIWRNKRLIKTLTKREILGRYRGSMLGIFWSFFHPLLMLAVYTLVFGEIFKTRFSDASHSTAEFSLLLFAGLLIFNFFAECINRAPGLILAHSNFVKKVVFPLEILSWVTVGTALFHAVISLFVWTIAYIWFYGWPHLSLLLVPFILLPFTLLLAGLTWILSALGVYLRDIAQVVTVGVSALMFISPIFYPAASLPKSFQHLLYINPLTPVIEWTRNAMFWGKTPDLMALFNFLVASVFVAWIGFYWFQKTRKGFADVV